MLTQREVLDPEVPLSIRIYPDTEKNQLRIIDTGIGMTAEEMDENLGTIAHSGARAFMEVAKDNSSAKVSDLIGQFGVGFYSAFMVADEIRVISRSYQPDAKAAEWYSNGEDTYTITEAQKETRGTEVILHLREDAKEFTESTRLREIITRHSDFIPFPIYIGDEQEQVNRQTAIWRQNPRQVEEKEYFEFYKQLTLDFNDPLTYTHLNVDAPVQMYAILFVPSSQERGMFSARKEDGLKLYARKILIQEYSRDLLPDYFRFVQGVVDSEDLPLNVSRESVQSNKVMSQLRKLLTAKTIDLLKKLGDDHPDTYAKFWKEFAPYIKQGIATEENEPQDLYPLLRYKSSTSLEKWVSLDEYAKRMQPEQPAIYYLLGDDERSVTRSPHLDLVRDHGYEVIFMTDPLDSFVLMRLTEFDGKPLKNLASAEVELPKVEKKEVAETTEESLPTSEYINIRDRFKTQLGDKIADVQITDRLSGSPVRLVEPKGSLTPEVQRVYRLMNREFEAPRKVLEVNPKHPIIIHLSQVEDTNPILGTIIDQLYENALLIEGLHPDPASMVDRIQKLMEASLNKP
jgi:molecular chaperone HtpG